MPLAKLSNLVCEIWMGRVGSSFINNVKIWEWGTAIAATLTILQECFTC
jgi:hypothetical protein